MTLKYIETNSTLCSAISYTHKGWSVVPIPHGEKGPNLKKWQDLRITAGEAAEYFGTGSNIGILLGEASGNLVCIDLDDEAAVELAEQFLPPTGLIAGRTQRPGTHWFYVVNGELKSKSHKLPPGSGGKPTVEILSTGRQVVVGPSIHPTGDVYDVLGDGEPAIVDAEDLNVAVGMLHAAVLDRLGLQESQPTEPKADRQPSGTPTSLRPGDDFNERGDVRELLRGHGWQFVHGGENEHWRRPGKDSGTSATLKDGKLFYVFSSAAAPFEPSHCYDPFGVFTILEHGGDFSAASVALRSAGYGDSVSNVDLSGLAAQATPADDADEFDADDLDDSTDGPLTFPTECLTPSGLLGDIVRHNLETALYPQPEFALGGALALLATVSGRKIADEFGTRPNCYILALGPSGCGKEHARQLNKQLLQMGGGTALIAPDGIASKQGVVSHLALTGSKLFQLDEIHRMLETMSNPAKSPHLYGILTVLLTLFSASRGPWESDAQSGIEKSKKIYCPNCVVYGTGIPDGFWESLSASNLTDGFAARFMLFEGVYIAEPVIRSVVDIPAPIFERVGAWVKLVAGSGDLSAMNPTAIVLQHSSQALERIADHIRSISRRRPTETPFRAAIWSRSGERANKFALLFAASRWDGAGPMPDIELGDVDAGIALSNYMTRRLLSQGTKFVAENEWDGKVKRVLRVIADHDPIGQTLLGRRTQWLPPRDREAILTHLFDTRQAFKLPPEKTGGRKKTLYTTRRSPTTTS